MKKLFALFALTIATSLSALAGTSAYNTPDRDECIRRTLTPLILSTYLHTTNDYTTASLPVDTATKINIPTLVKKVNGFAYDGTNNRFYLSQSGVTDRAFFISASTSMSVGTGNNVITVEVYQNGSLLQGISSRRKVSTAGDVGAVAVTGYLEASSDDYFEIYVTASLGGTITFSRTAINFVEIN